MADTAPSGTSLPDRTTPSAATEPEKAKTPKELEKERKKAEKLAKFEEKKKKQQQQTAPDSTSSSAKKKAAPATSISYVEETPPGHKKILKPLDHPYNKAYEPHIVESAWYSWWKEQGYFKPELKSKSIKDKSEDAFVIVIPPPNVTGKLHVGHALATALQDVLIRYARMKGKATLYLPGTDHAGISTQAVIETRLWRQQKKTRHDLGRKAFTDLVWQWKEDTHRQITETLQRLGASVDWDREAFTLDANLSRAVTETFVKLHEEGYIYRSSRLVNWCSALNTALSNLEVDNKEVNGKTLLEVPGYSKKVEFGVLTHFLYHIDGSDESIEVATTRPETILGDTGIAVHPQDQRYKHLVGKKARHPFIKDRLLPIVADDYVEMEFGTGAVKLTPAHDANDWELGKRHKLDFINILNDDGTMNVNAGPTYEGMKRFDVRTKIVEDLTNLGLFVKAVDNPMKIPLCAKSKDVIEFIPKPQWWMRMDELAKPALAVVQDGRVKIRPESARKNYEHWLSNMQDWCLSRQLWWGHQIPAYRVQLENSNTHDDNEENWVTGRSEEEAQAKAKAKFPDQPFTLKRDEDVLDTWFSSGLWPFSTLGWPEKTHDMQQFYPTALLETGWDILFFWVARMIIFGLKLTGDVPFTEVFCHGLVRDSEGRKMSKSLGNVIDPLAIVEGISLEELHSSLHTGNLDPKEISTAERWQKKAFKDGIPPCGVDALRLTLIDYVTPGGGDINFEISVISAYRRFCNKVFQASKFVLMNTLTTSFVPSATKELTGRESAADLWILSQLNEATLTINNALESREFNRATQAAFHYFRDSLCDVYIEYSKKTLREGSDSAKEIARQTLYTALEGGLLLLHPFMPFLTEELWQRLPRRPADGTPSIVVASFPEYDPALEKHADIVTQFALTLEIADAIKSLTSTQKPAKASFLVRAIGDVNKSQLSMADVYIHCQYVKPSLAENAIRFVESEEKSDDVLATIEQDHFVVSLQGGQ